MSYLNQNCCNIFFFKKNLFLFYFKILKIVEIIWSETPTKNA